MRLILKEFENFNSNDIIAKNITSKLEPLFDARDGAVVDLTDPTPPLIDISTDELTPQLILDLTRDEILMNNVMGSNIVQPNYVRLLLPGNPKFKKPDSVRVLRNGAYRTYSHWENDLFDMRSYIKGIK